MSKTFRLLITSIFVFVLISTNLFSQTGWAEVTTLPNLGSINSISVVDANTLWVCGDGGFVYLSTDGGTSWTLRNTGVPAVNLYGISATDANNCWVGTVAGAIYRTSNGGLNWAVQVSVAGSFINGIHMFDVNTGVYTGDPTGNGVPYQNRYTTDGGTTWTLAATSPLATNEFGVINAWDWTDQNHFWIGSASTVANATTAKIFYTTTGFAGTWNSATVAGTGTSSGLYYQAIGMTDNSNGMAGSNNGTVVKTTNGGVSWTAVTPPAALTTFAVINMNALKDGSNLIRVVFNSGSAYQIYTTTDYGTTWTEEVIPASAGSLGVQHLRFLDANLGYAGGGSGVVLKYTGVLPVELTSFTANVSEGNVQLNWTTATEINNQGFEIQRKTADDQYITIGHVNGNGTTTEAKQYSYSDAPEVGKYYYRLKQIDFNGTFEYSNEVFATIISPLEFTLDQNYPNPFNPITNISFTLAEPSFVKLSIYNLLGEEVQVLKNESMNAGTYNVGFDAVSFPSGMYLYKIETSQFSSVRKMMLMK
jgi:photosystem II stability/assembly factor-like uncharacterized protein